MAEIGSNSKITIATQQFSFQRTKERWVQDFTEQNKQSYMDKYSLKEIND